MTTAFFYDPIERQHDRLGHPENAARLASTVALLHQHNLPSELLDIAAQPATAEQLARVHEPGYVAFIRRAAESGGGWIDDMHETYVCAESYHAAAVAAGGAIAVTAAVLNGQANNGFVLMRPPGHHARPAQAMGFCLFGNIALAARAALDDFGLQRVMIIDWDVHHGNGTEEMFQRRDDVLFCSLHQYPHYPGTGAASNTGVGRGRGFTCNIPFPPGVGDAGYRRAFAEILWPLAERYRPELILVSAGYDAHWQDPLAEMQLSLAGYAELARTVRQMAAKVCGGKLVCVLEGGYHLNALSYGVLNTIRILLDEHAPALDPLGPCPDPELDASALLARVKALHDLA